MSHYFQTTRDVVRYAADTHVHGKVLDLGAGNAKYRSILIPRATEYITFDMVPGPHIDIVGDILKLPLADASYDTVLSTQVLEHVEKPWVMVHEIARVLKPGGKCIVSAPFMVPYHADPYDYFRYTTTGMTSLFKDEGFEVIECNSYGRVFTVFSEWFHFYFFNHYENPERHKKFRRLLAAVERAARFFDGLVKDSNAYPNVYIIAQKKS